MCSLNNFFSACVLLILATPSHAAVLLHENFNYTDGSSLTGQSGGVGFTGAWQTSVGDASAIMTTGGGLTYAGVSSSGNAALDDSASGSRGNYRQWVAPSGIFDDGDVLWFSALLNTTATASDIRIFAFTGTTVSFGGVGFNANVSGGNPSLRTAFGGSVSGTSVQGSSGTTLFLLARFTFSDVAGQDSVTTWLNPSTTSAPSNGGITLTGNISTTGTLLAGIRGGGGWTGSVDEMRLGETYFDVVPEPQPLHLFFLASGIWTLFRRSRSASSKSRS